MHAVRWLGFSVLCLLSWDIVAGQDVSVPVEITYPGVSLDRPSSLRLESPAQLTITDASGCEFNRVRALVLQRNGSMVVANSGNEELCFFDAGGQLIGREGRGGEGPGEYRDMTGLFSIAGDSLLVSDGILRRLSILDPGGRFIRSIALTPPDDQLGSLARVAVAGDGSILVGYMDPAPRQPSPESVELTMQLFRYDATGKLLNRLGRFPVSEHFIQTVPRTRGGIAYWDRAFGRALQLAPEGAGFVAADGRDFRVPQYSSDGRVVTIHHLEQELRPLPSSDIDAYKRLQLEDVQPNERALIERFIAEMPYPDTYPAFRGILTDSAGRIWLESYPAPGSTKGQWIVLDPRTHGTSVLTTPARFQVFAVSATAVCGVRRDELDLESVQCFRLHQTER